MVMDVAVKDDAAIVSSPSFSVAKSTIDSSSANLLLLVTLILFDALLELGFLERLFLNDLFTINLFN